MWLFAGIILGILVVLLVFWLRSRKINVRWYEWLLALVGLVLLLFAYQNYSASKIEYETVASGLLFLIFGLPGLLLLIIAVLRVWWREFRKAKAQPAPIKAASETSV